MLNARSLAAASVATLLLSACGSGGSSASDEQIEALQAQVEDLLEENAQLREQVEQQEPTSAETGSTVEEASTTDPPPEPVDTDPPEEDPEPTTADSAQVESLLAFNTVDPASFPEATAGEVTIVSVLDPSGRDSGLLVLRNGTDQTLTGFEVSVTGRDAAGTLVATGSDQGSVEPTLIGPGQLAIASIYMGVEAIPSETEFVYEIVNVQTDSEFLGSVSLPIVETSPTGGDVLGAVQNSTASEVFGPISVLYVCLGTGTEITGYAAAFADRDTLAPAATSPFRATIYRGDTCDRSIAGASGYDF